MGIRARVCASFLLVCAPMLFLVSSCLPDPPQPPGTSAVPGQPFLDPDEWKVVASHIHTSIGGERATVRGIEHVRKYAAKHGIDMVVVTDHNTIEGWFLKEFKAAGPPVLVEGEEWTSGGGHATLLGWDAAAPTDRVLPSDHASVSHAPPPWYKDMVDYVHAHGGLVIINHPKLKTSPWPDDTYGADGVEVGPNVSDLDGREAIGWWQSKLEAGERLAAWSGSDYHYLRPFPALDKPVNLVRMNKATQEALEEAVVGRRSEVLAERDAPRVLIGADLDGDLVFDDALLGDVIGGRPGDVVDLQIRVLGAKGQVTTIIETEVGSAGPTTKATSFETPSDDFVYRVLRTKRRGVEQFLRVEVGKTRLTGRPRTITNPIFW